jgi:hypothetical protein
MQTRVRLTCYVGVPISNEGSVNLMFGLSIDIWLWILELYLNNSPKRGNPYNIEFTRVSSYTQMTI